MLRTIEQRIQRKLEIIKIRHGKNWVETMGPVLGIKSQEEYVAKLKRMWSNDPKMKK